MPGVTLTSLPKLDYVSLVASLYKDRRAMVLGTLASVIAAAAVAIKADSDILWGHAALLLVLVVTRDLNARAFARAAIAPDDAEAAAHWEKRAVFFGYFAAAAYGSWCFSSIVLVEDPFAELAAITVTVAAMVGIAARNFGIDRLMTGQVLGMGGPMVLGLLMTGDVYHAILASLFLPMLFSFRLLGADLRNMLLGAVHDRVAARTLADQLDTALKTMQHGLCMLEEEGVIAVANAQARQIFADLAQGDWMGKRLPDLLDRAVGRGLLPRASAERLSRAIDSRSDGKITLELPNGSYCEVTLSSLEQQTVLLFEDVTQRMRAQERINFMARFDSLTRLPNRAHFTETAEADLARRQRADQQPEPALLAIIDLDDFKTINDTLGHLAGDQVLAEAASRIQTVMHPKSLLARYGGDEFVLYRRGHAEPSALDAEMGAILAAFSVPFVLAEERVEMGVSIGVAVAPERTLALDDLTSRADLALYRAKGRGKGKWQQFQSEMEVEFRYRQRLRADLRDAIANRQMRLVYQPLIDVTSLEVVGCEALVRWDHPELGFIPPDLFIPLAEETGAIHEITRWVLATAAAQCRTWPGSVTVSVNVSARDVRSAGLARDIDRALQESRLAPGRLEIEVTETSLIEERALAARKLSAIAQRGVGIALDDFGTGYSSLSYLNEMPFTKLKIDRSFIANIPGDKRSLKLLANMARLGRDLDLVVTAEGVETADQLDAIAAIPGIDQIQGYLFGAPLPETEIGAFIAAWPARRSLEAAARQQLPPIANR